MSKAIVSDEEVEIGAQVLRQVVADRAGKGKPWPALLPAVKDQYREEVRAVLTAIRALGQPLPF